MCLLLVSYIHGILLLFKSSLTDEYTSDYNEGMCVKERRVNLKIGLSHIDRWKVDKLRNHL